MMIIGPALMLEWPADNLDFLQLVQYLYLLVFNVLSQASAHGWVVTRKKWLKGSTIPAQGPTLDAKLATMGPN